VTGDRKSRLFFGKSDTTRKAGGLMNVVGSKPIAFVNLTAESEPADSSRNNLFHQQALYYAPSGLKIIGDQYPARCTGLSYVAPSGLVSISATRQTLIIY